MKQNALLIIIFFACSSAFTQTGPAAFLPDKDDVPGWIPAGEAIVFNEESLHSIAKEETKIILEYGFNYAASAKYYNYTNKEIDVQVYTMDNSFGSCGLFLRSSKNSEQFKEFGNSCYEKKDEFGFWKQFYFIRMTSRFPGDTVSQGFRQIAGFIDSKIKSKGQIPSILSFSKDRKGTVTIFKGPLALSEIYYFSPLNVFYVNEGIAIVSKDTTELIFRYSDNNEAVRRYSDLAGILSPMKKFSGFIMQGDYSYAMKDKDGKILVFKVEGDCLHVTIK